ncbi:MAG: hypothetical protein FWD04_08015 [Conexibacteraceae bacterium]|nr:hypothetical protein [Conexibacteraceae bacterium]
MSKLNLILGCTAIGTAGGVIAGLARSSNGADEVMIALLALAAVVGFVWLPDALHDRRH